MSVRDRVAQIAKSVLPRTINPNLPASTQDLVPLASQLSADQAPQGLGVPDDVARNVFGLGGALGPSTPLRRAPINPPGPSGLEMPRRWEYPVGFNLPAQPGAGKLIDFTTLRKLADVEPILRRCLETRKQEIAQLDWEIIPRDGRDLEDYSEAINTAKRFFRTPDRINGLGMDDFLKQMLEEVFVVDALSIYKRPNRAGKLHSLQIIDGTTIKPLIDQWGDRPMAPAPAYQQFVFGMPRTDLYAAEPPIAYDDTDHASMRGQRDPTKLNPEDVRPLTTEELLYRPYVRRTWTMYGFPNVEQILTYITLQLRRTAWHISWFTEGNVPPMFGIAPEDWGPDTLNQMNELWEQQWAGDMGFRQRIRWVPFGTEFQDVKDMNLHPVEFDQLLIEIICAGMDVSPNELGFTQNVNKSEGEQQQNVMYRRSLRPLISWIQTIFDEILEIDFGLPMLRFRFLGIEWEDEQLEANIHKTLVESAIETIDEARLQRGLTPYEGGLGSVPIVVAGRTVVKLQDILTMSPAALQGDPVAPDEQNRETLSDKEPRDVAPPTQNNILPANKPRELMPPRRPTGAPDPEPRPSGPAAAVHAAAEGHDPGAQKMDYPDGPTQMCCAGGMTADEHRHLTDDGRCCTDTPPTTDEDAMADAAAATITEALGAYEKFAVSRARRGRGLRPFTSALPPMIADPIHRALSTLHEDGALTPDAVKTIFAEVRRGTLNEAGGVMQQPFEIHVHEDDAATPDAVKAAEGDSGGITRPPLEVHVHPSVTFTPEPPTVNVNVPPAPPPTVNVDVNVPPAPAPTVNVEVPPPARRNRRVERDPEGNLTRIVEEDDE